MIENNLSRPVKLFHKLLVSAYKKSAKIKSRGNSPLDIPGKSVFYSFCAAIFFGLVIGNLFIHYLHYRIGSKSLLKIEQGEAYSETDTTSSVDLIHFLLPHWSPKIDELDSKIAEELNNTFNDGKITVASLNRFIGGTIDEGTLKRLIVGELNHDWILIPLFKPLSPDKIADEIKMFPKHKQEDKYAKENWNRLIFISAVQHLRNELDNGITQPRRLLLALGGGIQWITFIAALWCLILLLLLRTPWIRLQAYLVTNHHLPWHDDSDTRDIWNINDPYYAKLDLGENYPGAFVASRLIKDVVNIADSDESISGYGEVRERIEAYRNSVDVGEYEIINFLIWATPTFGFIGTIFGIISAMENAAAIFSAANPIAQAVALDKVSTALGTAFDTSFIALICLVPMSFFLARTRKAEANFFENLEFEGVSNLPPQVRELRKNKKKEEAA